MNLTPKEIAYLLPSFIDRTALSLFSNISAKPDGTEHETLTQKGIIKGNEYSKEALEILMHIAKPTRCGRLIAKNEFFVIEKYTYWNAGRIVLAENRNGEFAFSKIEKFNDVLINLSEFFSLSNIKTSDVSISVKIDEMLVLLAIIDIYRKNTLLNYAGKTNEAETVSLQEITSELSNGFENGLVKVIIKNYGYKTPDLNEIPDILATLITKNCLVFENGYKLTTNFAQLATSFLKLESVLLYDAFEIMPDGNIPVDGGIFVVAGIHDIVSFAFDEESIELTSVSAYQMLTIIEKVLSCPELVQKIPQAAQQSAVPVTPIIQQAPVQTAATATQPINNNTWQCSCGRVNTANFCAACGSKKP